MNRVRIVTDSTSDIPSQLAQESGVSVVPCYINFETESLLDQVEILRPEFYRRLVSEGVHPTTAAPPPGMFAEVYRGLLEDATGIISIHPPDHLSALQKSALIGWDLVHNPDSLPFRALDGGLLSMGLGWVVIRAAQAAAAGASMAEIEELVAQLRPRVHLYAALDTIEYLRRSGRVGWTRGAIGKLLRIRPLLHLYQGEILSVGATRTRKNSLDRLLTLFRELGEIEELTVLHSNAPERAKEFRSMLLELQPIEPVMTINITPVLGTHVGPAGIGFVAIQR